MRSALNRIRLSELTWVSGRPTELAVALSVVQVALDQFLENLNGAIKPVVLHIAFSPFEPINPNSISATGGSTALAINLSQ